MVIFGLQTDFGNLISDLPLPLNLRSMLLLTNVRPRSLFWIGVGRCRISWLAPAGMKENYNAQSRRRQSMTLIGSHKSSFTIQTVPSLTCAWGHDANSRLSKKPVFAIMRRKQQQTKHAAVKLMCMNGMNYAYSAMEPRSYLKVIKTNKVAKVRFVAVDIVA